MGAMVSYDTISSEKLLIVSSDGHIGPPAERYRDYFDPRYRADFDQWFEQYIPLWMTKGTRAEDSVKETLTANMWGQEYQREFEARAAKIPWGIEGKWDAAKRLQALDVDGVTSDVMFPDDQSSNSPPFLGLARDYRERWDTWSHHQRREGARAYNRWLSDFCATAPERLLGVALIGSLADVDDAMETVRYAKDHGINGGLMLPVHYYNVDEPFWNDRRYEPLWALCAELDMPLHTHVGPGSPYYGDDSFEGMLIWAMESTFWVHRPLWFFTFSGIFERHPNLKLVFTEQGVEWIPGSLFGMDMVLEGKLTPFSTDERRAMFSLKPSEYFKRQCWVGATNTDALGWVTSEQREQIGTDRIMWGSDYPHMESAWPHTRQKLHDLVKGIPSGDVRAIVAGNAIDCYGLDVAKLQSIADRIGPTTEEIVNE
jgi:predicted TIM-barrel fold metal-dependent hydrolase